MKPLRMRGIICRMAISLTIIIAFCVPSVGAQGDMVIGAVENIVLMPEKISLPARIDTGAATTSLDARELAIRDGMVEFRIPDIYGGKQMQLPLKGWKQIKSSGAEQRRPVVEMGICIGDKHLRIDINLTDRSRVQYPLLIGRDVLEKGFIVDVRKMHSLPPHCRELTRP